jgi:hypothetical protein
MAEQQNEYLYGPEFVEFIRNQVKAHPNVTELSFDTRIERQALIRFRNGNQMKDESFVALARYCGWALIARRIAAPPAPQG